MPHVLLFTPTGVEVTAVVDRAEIPTAQALQDIAPDGSPSPDNWPRPPTAQCAELSPADVRLAVDGMPVAWRASRAARWRRCPAPARLPTLRLPAHLRAGGRLDDAAVVPSRTSYLPDRVGWREITADGDGVRLLDSPVPVHSISDELRTYPDDLLASPLDVRSFSVADRARREHRRRARRSPRRSATRSAARWRRWTAGWRTSSGTGA